MGTNRGWGQKLAERRKIMDRRSDTPRTDNFVQTQATLILDVADFADHEAMVRVTTHIREHMVGWAEFARELEREIQRSVPQEWNILPHRK